MSFDQERMRLGYRGSVASRAWNVVAKTLTVGFAGILLVSAIAMSIVLFAIGLAALCIFGAYFWWKTRHLRKQLRTQLERGDAIDGVVVREVEVRQITYRDEE